MASNGRGFSLGVCFAVEGEDFYNGAEAGVVALAHEAAEMYDLEPSLTEALDDACREEDVARSKEAVTNILQAVDEARGSL